MQGTMIYGPRDRFEDRPDPTIIQPTDAILRAMDERRAIKTPLQP